MAPAYNYIISIQDKASSTLQRIGGTSLETVEKLLSLSDKAEALQRTTKDLGGTLGNLRQKLSLLKDEKELIDPKNMPLLKQYNREIGGLEKQIDKLDNAGSGGGLKRYFKGLAGMINPVEIAAQIGESTVKSALNFDKGMTAVNLTTKLDDKGLDNLKERVKKIAIDNKSEVELAPGNLKNIISQVGDTETSLKILDASMKGARASASDMDSVSNALAQTMSAVGTKNADVGQVLDTFMAAKRIGAGDFKDFANYIPGLISGASSLGLSYKGVAGVFAYMTSKGQNAERSATMMQSMFSTMSKTDIAGKLESAGAAIYDNEGKMRSMVDIFTDLNKITGSMSAEQKSAFLEQIGIVDKDAKSAFAVMASDVDRLRESMNATQNAQGETDKAMALSENVTQKANDAWATLKNTGFVLGEMILPIMSVAFDVLGAALDVVASIIATISDFFSGWNQLLLDGNPLIWGLTAALAVLGIALSAHAIYLNSSTIATKAKVVWDWLATAGTWGWEVAQWALNASLLGCPLVWIILAIGALVAIIVFCVTKVQGWGKQWDSIVNFMKAVFELFIESFRFHWTSLTNGFMMGLDKIKLGWYKFKEAVGLGDSSENQAAIAQINADVESRQKEITAGAKKIQELALKAKNSLKWELSMKPQEKAASQQGKTTQTQTSETLPTGSTPPLDFDALMKKIDAGNNNKKVGKGAEKKGGTAPLANHNTLMDKTNGGINSQSTSTGSGGSNIIDLNGKAASYKGTTSYSAIVSKLAPVKLSTLAAAASVALPIATAPAISTGEMTPPLLSNEQYVEQPRQQKSVNVDRLCNSVVINIESADGKGYERIRKEVLEVVKNVFEDYA